jgi:uncharacterized damage-inducible protein DinB
MSIRLFYDRWPQYNRRLIETIGGLSDEQLALRPSPEHWPVWALVGHVAGTRVYWLCQVLHEPGAEATPFVDPWSDGWEDHPEHPRTADELVEALQSTFAIVDRILDAWTPEMLSDEFERFYLDQRQVHTRTSVVQRLMTHEAYHGGEISQTLGVEGLDPVYIWRPY